MKHNSKRILIILILITGLIFIGIKMPNKTTELIQLKNNTNAQMMGYMIKTENNKIIVIDGGKTGDTQNLIDKINSYTRKN